VLTRQDVLELFTSQAELARACGVSRATINGWKTSDKPVPAEYVKRVVLAAMENGLVLTPQMIRPDLWPNPLGNTDAD
jgi:DNA-binding transcriptional regulator YdaS (Cro superfamily)